MTPGRVFYGPRGPYANFAGRDASRGLALGSFEEDVLTKDLDGPLDTLSDLDQEQQAMLDDWEQRFREKYLLVGRLVAEGTVTGEDKGAVGEGEESDIGDGFVEKSTVAELKGSDVGDSS